MILDTTTGTQVAVTLTAYIEGAGSYRCYGVDRQGQYWLWTSFDRVASPVPHGVGTPDAPYFPEEPARKGR